MNHQTIDHDRSISQERTPDLHIPSFWKVTSSDIDFFEFRSTSHVFGSPPVANTTAKAWCGADADGRMLRFLIREIALWIG